MMKVFTRFLTLGLSVAALGLVSSLAQAGSWLPFNLFGGQSDQQSAAPSQTDNSTTITKSPPAAATTTTQVATRNGQFKDGTFPGPTYDAYYGLLQVQANIQGGKLISVDVLQYPTHRNTSRLINRQALPMLEREVVRAQSVRVNLISGATLTSEAYLSSLFYALQQASI
jgi:uncharacterized protein with FMN-binding domain